MSSSTRTRLLVAGAAVLLILIGYALLVRTAQEPTPRSFNPGAFVEPPPRLDAPQIASDMEVVDAMLGLAEVRPGEQVVDLGSGDGRILIAAARSNGARGLGVDIDPRAIADANRNARAAGVTGLVAFRREDLFRTPLGEADVLTLYLTREVNLRLRQRILAEMRPGARLVSHDYDMGDWHWDQRQRVGAATVYLWIVPARIAGNWTLSVDGLTVPLVVDQRFQRFTGSVREARIEEGSITGDRIRFRANLSEHRRTFEGRLTGGRIVPIDPQAGWQAVRSS